MNLSHIVIIIGFLAHTPLEHLITFHKLTLYKLYNNGIAKMSMLVRPVVLKLFVRGPHKIHLPSLATPHTF